MRHPLHAKLYLLFRPDPINPTVGYLGSSNLTFAGLSNQGELNVDVLDQDACQKLANGSRTAGTIAGASTFPTNWSQIIEESWAREQPPAALPYLPEDRLPSFPGGPGRPDRVPDSPRLRRASSSSFRSPRSRSRPII